MALVLADRVKETSTTTGTGTITLAGAVAGFSSFSEVGDGNTTYYAIVSQTPGEWEVGIGTYAASGTTLSRDTVLASTNAGSAVDFSAGTKDVFVTYPAEKSSISFPGAAKTANYTAAASEGVLTDTSGGAFTVTLPASPAVGDQVVVTDSASSWGTNNLTIGRNGATIAGVAEDLACDLSGVSVQFVYDGSTWNVYAQVGAQSGDVVTLTGTETLTNKNIEQRVVVVSDGTSVTINADITDMATQANTQSAGTLTINAPTGTPYNGQKLMLRLKSDAVQTFSWNSAYAGSSDLPLPSASSGSGLYDYVGFMYNSTAAKWQIVAKNFGF